MSLQRKSVLAAAVLLFAVWAFANMGRLAGDDDAAIRITLVSIFAILILVRSRFAPAADEAKAFLPALPSLFCGVGGALLAVVGMILTVHLFEWLGLLLVLYACLRWALPRRYQRDLIIALILLYWMHPLPGQVFGRFQLWMQWLSVQGAEWLLHCFELPVWANGFVLHTGLLTLGIPEACSGMRTAVTVLLCTLGVSFLMRLRWYHILVFLAAGLVQVLLLNIVRIAIVVYVAPKVGQETAEHALHDTLGIFLLVTILLVQLEVSWWKLWRDRRQFIKDGIKRGELERPDRGRALPGTWRLLKNWWKRGLAVGLVLLLGAYLTRQRMSGTRLRLMRPVIDLMMEIEPEEAEVAIDAALTWAPTDRDLLQLKAHTLVVKGKFEQALELIGSLPPPLQVVEVVMKSRAQISLGRIDEAFETVSVLAGQAPSRPGVAMILAEYAAAKDIPEDVNKYIVMAAQSHLVQQRVRALFPYLALHEQWRVVAKCDNENITYEDVAPALVAIQAHLSQLNFARASEIMQDVQERYPDDPRFLSSLFSLAVSRQGGEWESLFAENMRANIQGFDADRLSSLIDYSFRLVRPDLAWLAWEQLRQVDQRDPALMLSAARFFSSWMTVRRHAIDVTSEQKGAGIDLRRFHALTRDLQPFSGLWGVVPLANEVAVASQQGRDHYLNRYFEEVRRRETEGTLTERMELGIAPALGLAGRYEEAHAKLNELENKYPARKRDLLYQRAAFCNTQRQWQKLYEALIEYRQLPNYQPRLGVDMMLINAMMNLNMGVAAMHVAEQANRVYPGSEPVQSSLAGIWNVFGYKDMALFAMTRGVADPDPRLMVQLLYESGRYANAHRLSTLLGVGITRTQAGERQRLLARKAELTLAKRWPPPMTDAELAEEQAGYEGELALSTSPYVAALRTLGRDWCRTRGAGEASNPVRWEAVCRTSFEKAGALHHLCMLLARERRYEDAAGVIDRAVSLLPDSAILLRIQVALHEGDYETVEAAFSARPDDPDLWLARLVTRFNKEGSGEWLDPFITAATADNSYPCEAFVRAGAFLLRHRAPERAAVLARHAIQEAEGLLTAYVLGLHCALVLKDSEWAVRCSLAGAEQARDPAAFHRTVVLLKWDRGERDTDLVNALQFLQSKFPEEPEWPERLGYLYFERQDNRRALSVLGPIIERDIKKVRLKTLLTAAEAARHEGNHVQAVRILEGAYAMYPDRVNVLNNLIYTLLEDARTRPRARDLLPSLLSLGGETFPVLDTAAMVYLHSGMVGRAREYMERALAMLNMEHYAALEVTVNAAELYLQAGDYERARMHLENVRNYPDRPAAIDRRAAAIRRQLDERN